MQHSINAKSTDILLQLFTLFYVYRLCGPTTIERHIEDPEKSDILSSRSFLQSQRLLSFLRESLSVILIDEIDPQLFKDLLRLDLDAGEIESEELVWLNMVAQMLYGFYASKSPFVAVEFGRRVLPPSQRPEFGEVSDRCLAIAKALPLNKESK